MDKKVKSMSANKKQPKSSQAQTGSQQKYVKPSLRVIGSLEELTKFNGSTSIDFFGPRS